MFDEVSYKKKLKLMDGDDLEELEYYLVADLEHESSKKVLRQIELIQQEYKSRGY